MIHPLNSKSITNTTLKESFQPIKISEGISWTEGYTSRSTIPGATEIICQPLYFRDGGQGRKPGTITGKGLVLMLLLISDSCQVVTFWQEDLKLDVPYLSMGDGYQL